MSRITKFLRQKCLFEQAIRGDNGLVEHDEYGEVSYAIAREIKCRRERCIRDVQTNTGAVLRSSTRYFLDNTIQIEAEDRLDGQAILTVEDMVNHAGHVEGYECYV